MAANPLPGYVAATVPAAIIRTSGTTLFQVAASQFSDPLTWSAFAALNGTLDPWINEQTDVLVPPIQPTGMKSGLYAPVIGGATAGIEPGAPAPTPPVPVPTPTPPAPTPANAALIVIAAGL